MENNRPRRREKQVEGPGKTVGKRGEGLGTGPVGDAGGYQDRKRKTDTGSRSAGKGGGGMKLIALLLVLLLGGGGGLTSMLSGQQGTAPSAGQQAFQGGGSGSWAEMLSGLGGGSVSSGWQEAANTGRLDESVTPGAREKYTRLLGNGRNTVTLMVYMCGTDLESRSGMGTADLQEMLNARFGDSVNLLVYTGGCRQWKNSAVSSENNQIWQVRNGKLVCLEKNLGSVSMTKTATLVDYIRWCAKNFPASRYGLILWDHGGGSVSGYGYDEKFASTGSMSLFGVDEALRDAGVKFDFVGFDACLMATAETALMLSRHADYLIASEETEPGVGWYYTDWLTALGENPSMPTLQIGRNIVDSFVDTCAQKCPGQLTTLSVVDLAELEATLPDTLADFSRAASQMIRAGEYQTISNARSGAREFAKSSKIDQVDLVHLARNLNSREGDALAEALLGAVKYNRTSSNMTNAYGLSIYFPYQKSSRVEQAAATYRAIGLDDSYSRCIQDFASIQTVGQVGGGGSGSPLEALLGLSGSGGGTSAEAISGLLQAALGSGFFSDRSLDLNQAAQYVAEHRFAEEELLWQRGETGQPVLYLREEQWGLVQSLELNLFYDDGEGYIDLGLDNVYDVDEAGGLLGEDGGSWLALNGQPVAYYHTATVDDGTNYTITGRVPLLHNGSRAELILVFDNERPEGFVAGVQTVYPGGETETAAKNQTGLQPGDRLEFLCDYYSYSGDYQDSYFLGEPLTVPEEGLTIQDVPLEGSTQATYCFTDLYGQRHWTPAVPAA
ncbi:MAG: peptidase C11 [Oscillibacter sp.]|nr:peptidase C11 [Oscillibacter sp.]